MRAHRVAVALGFRVGATSCGSLQGWAQLRPTPAIGRTPTQYPSSLILTEFIESSPGVTAAGARHRPRPVLVAAPDAAAHAGSDAYASERVTVCSKRNVQARLSRASPRFFVSGSPREALSGQRRRS